MNVLIVGNFLSGSGGNRAVCEDLADQLRARGHDLTTTSRKRTRARRLADMLKTAWRCRDHYDVAEIDVFSGPAFFWAEATAYVLRRAGKPYILTLRGGNLPAFARNRPRRVARLLLSASAVTTPSRYLVENMYPYLQDLRLLPNPIDLDAYTFRSRIRPEPTILWLRAFHAIYNPPLLAHVVAVLAQDFLDVKATMIGPDKGDGSLNATRQLAVRLAVSDRLAFPGGVAKTDVPSWLARGDIFVNTTNVDNTPMSVIEAMACGLPVVSTNVGGIPYLLEHEHDALLVPPGDVMEMANAIRRILTEPVLAQRLSQNAREKVEAFDWSIVLPQWETLFMEVIEKYG